MNFSIDNDFLQIKINKIVNYLMIDMNQIYYLSDTEEK